MQSHPMNIRLSDVSGVPDPTDLMKKDDHIFIDLMPYAHLLKSLMPEDSFMAPEEGLYLEHSLTPFLRLDDPFMTKSVPFAQTLRDVADLSVFSENIYDMKGNLIMGFGPGFPQVYLGTTNPVVELQVVQVFLENEIYGSLKWNPQVVRKSYRDLLNLEEFKYVNENNRIVYDYEAVENFLQSIEGKVVEILDGLSLMVGDFIRDRSWNMYDISYSNSIACIRRGVDYRVYEWTRIHFEHEQNKLRIARGE
jgi:hypothetical protein